MSPREAARLDVYNPFLALSEKLRVTRTVAIVAPVHEACEREGYRTAIEVNLFGDEIVRCTSCCSVLPKEMAR